MHPDHLLQVLDLITNFKKQDLDMKANKLLYILPLAALTACDPDIDELDINNGTADFSRTVTVGNSLTAGFQSNALRRNKQIVSYPAMLAEQFAKVGGGDFKQPLLAEGVGVGSSQNAEFGLFLRPNCNDEVGPSPGPIAPAGQADQFSPATYIGAEGPYNNVGVPGAKSFHLVTPNYGNPAGINTGTANPFYARFANPMNFNETVLEQAQAVDATFFTLFIGNNDVLSYSTSGGSGNANPGMDPRTYGPNDITNVAVFNAAYSQLIAGLTANGAKGAVANIPDVTSIPYFTTVKWNALVLTQEQANQLNAGFASYNGALASYRTAGVITATEESKRRISFSAGSNGFVRLDEDLTALVNPADGSQIPKMRQLGAGELVTLVTPGDKIRCEGFGSATPMGPNPLTENFVLDSAEVAAVVAATASYNNIIKNLAQTNGLAFVDANAKLRELASGGLTISGANFNSDFISGGAFSLDGVHPSTRGYAIIANEFIKSINATYGANVPKVDVTSFETIVTQ